MQFSNPLKTVHPKKILYELLHNRYIEENLLCSHWCSEQQMNTLQRNNHPQQHGIGADCQDKEQGSLAVPSLLLPCQQRHSTHSSFRTAFMEASLAVSLIPSVPHLLYHLQNNTKKAIVCWNRKPWQICVTLFLSLIYTSVRNSA